MAMTQGGSGLEGLAGQSVQGVCLARLIRLRSAAQGLPPMLPGGVGEDRDAIPQWVPPTLASAPAALRRSRRR